MEGCLEIYVDSMDYAEQAAEGSSLGIYRFQENKRKQDKIVSPKLELWDSGDVDSWTKGLLKGEAQNLARRLSDTPANQMTPTAFAQVIICCSDL